MFSSKTIGPHVNSVFSFVHYLGWFRERMCLHRCSFDHLPFCKGWDSNARAMAFESVYVRGAQVYWTSVARASGISVILFCFNSCLPFVTVLIYAFHPLAKPFTVCVRFVCWRWWRYRFVGEPGVEPVQDWLSLFSATRSRRWGPPVPYRIIP